MTTLPAVPLSGQTRAAQTALTVLSAARPQADGHGPDLVHKDRSAPETGIEALMRYAKTAKALARPETTDESLPPPTGGGVDHAGRLRSEVMALDQLPAEYADALRSLGATQVVELTYPPISDAEFQQIAGAALDDWYAGDAGYQAAKAAGTLRVQRMSEIEAEVPGFRHSYGEFELYRGNECIGGASTGLLSDVFERFWAEQEAAGIKVVPGGSQGTDFVARWPVI